jgi:hypothetical protein
MLPEAWLKQTPVIKARNRLPAWSRDDVLRFCEAEFGTTDLTKQQLFDLVEKLRAPDVEKAARTISPLGLLAPAVEEKAYPVEELTFVPVRDRCGYAQTHFYFAGARAGIRFGSTRDAVKWTLERLADDVGRLGWNRALATWREITLLGRFDPALHPGVGVDAVLAKQLASRRQQSVLLNTPYPENETMTKRFWASSPGDRFKHPDGTQLVVTEAQPRLDGPPVLTCIKETANA